MENYESSYASTGISSTVIVIYLIVLLVVFAGMWKVFTKAGKPGWAAIIPIYNLIVLLEIVGKPLWWFFLLLVPCVNIVFLVIIYNELSKSFGKGAGFTVGLILLSPIFFPILGFGDAVYLGPGGAPFIYGADDYQKPFDINPEA